jgi:hypothetical protein
MNIFENIFNGKEFKIKCIDKYDMKPYYTCIRELLEISSNYELLEVGKEYTVTNIRIYETITLLTLKEFPNKEFISALFDDLYKEENEEKYKIKYKVYTVKEKRLIDEIEIGEIIENTMYCYSTMNGEYCEYYLDDDDIFMERD